MIPKPFVINDAIIVKNTVNLMTKVAILGCGWLGLPLAIKLLKSGYHVNGSTTSEKRGNFN